MPRENVGVVKREESPMTEHPILSTGSRMAPDRRNKLMGSARELVLMDDFQLPGNQARRLRKPRITVISGSASYDAPTTTIDVTDYREIKAPVQTAKRTDHSLRFIVGPLVVFAAAAVVAITLSLAPASDGPAPIAGPLSGHSILHDPR